MGAQGHAGPGYPPYRNEILAKFFTKPRDASLLDHYKDYNGLVSLAVHTLILLEIETMQIDLEHAPIQQHGPPSSVDPMRDALPAGGAR